MPQVPVGFEKVAEVIADGWRSRARRFGKTGFVSVAKTEACAEVRLEYIVGLRLERPDAGLRIEKLGVSAPKIQNRLSRGAVPIGAADGYRLTEIVGPETKRIEGRPC